MSLTTEDVQKIAHLSRLAVKPEEISRLQRDLSNILDLVDQMNSVNTDNIEPMAHPLSMTQRLRTDAATEQNQRENYQTVAPHTEKGLYLVPRVIE